MNSVGIGIGIGLIVLLLVQAWLVLGFARAIADFARPRLADGECPRCALILCLRGSDPFLQRCIESILDQDYPRYDVHIVLDHADDPAASVVAQSLRNHESARVKVEVLRDRLATCSLKCSSVVQVLRGLDADVNFIAQVDADTVPHHSWLRELAGALAPADVGAATGNRWYMPPTAEWGSLVRYHWNAGAIVQMYWYRIAWGGTLAVKTQVLHQAGLLEHWSRALCEDTMLFAKLRPIGFRVAFVPSLMMVNREDCRLGDFYGWVQRQLLTARLYHPGWIAVVGHAFLTSVVPAAAIVVVAWGLLTGWLTGTTISLVALAVYEWGLLQVVAIMDRRMRELVRARHEPVTRLAGKAHLRLLLALPLTQTVYAFAMISAMFRRRFSWRGIIYQVDGPWRIRMLGYRPYEPSPQQGDGSSL